MAQVEVIRRALPARPSTKRPPTVAPAVRTIKINGVVKFYDQVKGFGFIRRRDRGEDVYVGHKEVTAAGLDILHEGDRIAFNVVDAGGARCRAVRLELVEPASTAPPATGPAQRRRDLGVMRETQNFAAPRSFKCRS